ncbi:PaaI family thioesterase [Rhizobium puerariae]|uniref:PaaI family thioesterase n=1 Tax=Rhizobium puerariae TaxID=1585791 RepID=A0ABV6AIU6_9HYPH
MMQAPDFSQLCFRPFREDDTLLASLGKVCIAENGTGLVLRLECGANAVNPGGFVHGGATAALFDVALYETARAAFEAEAVTSALDVKFLAAGGPQLPLHVVTQNLKAGRTMATCIGSAFQNGKMIACATGQFVRGAADMRGASISNAP